MVIRRRADGFRRRRRCAREPSCTASPTGSTRSFSPTRAQRKSTRDQVAAHVRHVLRGCNGCVLAYGQTCSGKTTTIRGPSDGAAAWRADCDESVIQLLEAIEIDHWSQRSVDAGSLVHRNLQRDRRRPPQRPRRPRGSPTERTARVAAELAQVRITDWKQAEAALRWGERHRHVSATLRNERSSRAHVVCRLRLARAATEADPNACTSELNIVDLAGAASRPIRAGWDQTATRARRGRAYQQVAPRALDRDPKAGRRRLHRRAGRPARARGSTPRTRRAARSLGGGGGGGGGGGVRRPRARRAYRGARHPTHACRAWRQPRRPPSPAARGTRSRRRRRRSRRAARLTCRAQDHAAPAGLARGWRGLPYHMPRAHPRATTSTGGSTLRFALRARRLTLQPVSAPLVPFMRCVCAPTRASSRARGVRSICSLRRRARQEAAARARRPSVASRRHILAAAAVTVAMVVPRARATPGAAARLRREGSERSTMRLLERRRVGQRAGCVRCGCRPRSLSPRRSQANLPPRVPAASAPSSAFSGTCRRPPPPFRSSPPRTRRRRSRAPARASGAAVVAPRLARRRPTPLPDRDRGRLAASRAALARMEAQAVELQDRLDAEAAARRERARR